MKRPPIPKSFLGAFKAGHRATSRDSIDEELSYLLLNRILDSNYADIEAVNLLTFIAKFNNEFHKNVIKKGDESALHNTNELRRDCYSRENCRNRDILSRDSFKLTSFDDNLESIQGTLDRGIASHFSDHEEVLISLIAVSRQF